MYHCDMKSPFYDFRQYRTRIVRQMRRQIFRQMKQKAQ